METNQHRNFNEEQLTLLLTEDLLRRVVIVDVIIFRTLIKHEHFGKILIKVTPGLSINYLNVNKTDQFICDTKRTYLVYGKNFRLYIYKC